MQSRDRGLEIGQDLRFQRRQWRIQRAGWVGIALVLVLALLGLFGNGVLSKAQVAGPSLEIRYERFLRENAPTQLDVTVLADAANAGEIRIAIDRQYLDAFRIEDVLPRPQRVESAPQGVVFVFATGSQAARLRVTFHATAIDAGRHTGAVRVLHGATSPWVKFDQLIYP